MRYFCVALVACLVGKHTSAGCRSRRREMGCVLKRLPERMVCDAHAVSVALSMICMSGQSVGDADTLHSNNKKNKSTSSQRGASW